MNFILSILYGLIQGICEPLPVSSSGHIFLLKRLFQGPFFQSFSFEIFLNFASFIAIFWIYRKDILSLCLNSFSYVFFQKKNCYSSFRYVLLLIIGTLPVGIAGFFLKDFMERLFYYHPILLGFGFLFTGLLLLFIKSSHQKGEEDICYLDAFIIGLFQVIALFPGISRSGMCLIGCFFCGLKKESALRFSFFLYFPVSFFSMLLAFPQFFSFSFSFSLFFSFFFAFLGTLFSYSYLKRSIIEDSLWKFSLYLFGIGIVSFFIL